VEEKLGKPGKVSFVWLLVVEWTFRENLCYIKMTDYWKGECFLTASRISIFTLFIFRKTPIQFHHSSNNFFCQHHEWTVSPKSTTEIKQILNFHQTEKQTKLWRSISIESVFWSLEIDLKLAIDGVGFSIVALFEFMNN
jgi:hypothetical protein